MKLNANWVVLSACNTAAAGNSGEAARSLLVSYWPVNSYAATMITTTAFAQLEADPTIGRSEALRRAMASLANDDNRPWGRSSVRLGAHRFGGRGPGCTVNEV